MPWQSIGISDVENAMSGAEYSAFSQAVLASGQDPTLTTGAILTNVVNLCRGYIVGCQNNRLGAAGTIPDILVSPCIALAVEQIMSRCAGIILDPEGVRKRKAQEAMQIFKDVSAARIMLERPLTLDTEQIGYQSPSFHGRRPNYRNEYGV